MQRWGWLVPGGHKQAVVTSLCNNQILWMTGSYFGVYECACMCPLSVLFPFLLKIVPNSWRTFLTADARSMVIRLRCLIWSLANLLKIPSWILEWLVVGVSWEDTGAPPLASAVLRRYWGQSPASFQWSQSHSKHRGLVYTAWGHPRSYCDVVVLWDVPPDPTQWGICWIWE